MKKVKYCFEKTMAAIAIKFATSTANAACPFSYHQPVVPKELKKLRKF